MRLIVGKMREGEYGEAAKFAGAFAHVIEDLGQPQCHALEGINGFSWTTLDEIFTPEDQSWNRAPQSIIDLDEDPRFVVRLGDYRPQLLGMHAEEVAFRLYHRCCRLRQVARKALPAMLTRVYAGDGGGAVAATVPPAVEDAKLVADLFSTCFALAAGQFDPADAKALETLDLTSLVPIIAPLLINFPYRFSPLAYGCCVNMNREPVPLRLWLQEGDRPRREVVLAKGIGTGCCRFGYEIPKDVFREFCCTAGLHSQLGLHPSGANLTSPSASAAKRCSTAACWRPDHWRKRWLFRSRREAHWSSSRKVARVPPAMRPITRSGENRSWSAWTAAKPRRRHLRKRRRQKHGDGGKRQHDQNDLWDNADCSCLFHVVRNAESRSQDEGPVMRTIIDADRTDGAVFPVQTVWGLLAAVCLNCFPAMISVALEPTAGDAGKGTVLIARDGKPATVIVLARNPTRPAQLAAKEFAHYVGKITGAELPTVSDDAPLAQSASNRVLIGESAETRKLGLVNGSFAVQEYLVQTQGHTLILMGRDAEEYGPITYEKTGYWPTTGDWRTVFFLPVGSVYAVHTFLEKYCGVRWYLPGDIGEVCPTQTTLTASDVHLRTRPWTRCRWSSRQIYRDPLKFYGWRQPDERVCIPVRDMALWMFRMKMGGSPYACNHAFTRYYERFGKTHPEWWKDGKPSDQYPHPDYANPELIRQAAQDAIEYFSTGKKYPGATADGDYFAIMPNDGKKGLIWSAAGERLRNNDPDRQAGYSCGWGSELVFQMVNTAAHIVRQKHPDKWITCSAYAGYSLPPKTIAALEPNVSIQRAGFLDSAFAPPQWKWETENLAAWSKLTPELYVWEYYLTQWFQKFKAFPVVYPRYVARSMQFLRQIGVRGMFFEASAAKLPAAAYSDGALANPAEDLLNHYVTWKLLSDPSQDVEQLLQEFYPLFFGPAVPPMKEFFTLLESRWTAPEVVASTLPPDRKYWEVMCTPPILDALQARSIGPWPWRGKSPTTRGSC